MRGFCLSGQADERLGTRSAELQQIIAAASSDNSSGTASKIDQMSPATKLKLQNDLRRMAEEGSSGARRCPRWLQFIYAAMACAQGQGCEEIAKVLAGGALCEDLPLSFDALNITGDGKFGEADAIQQAVNLAQGKLKEENPGTSFDLELGADLQANCEVTVEGVEKEIPWTVKHWYYPGSPIYAGKSCLEVATSAWLYNAEPYGWIKSPPKLVSCVKKNDELHYEIIGQVYNWKIKPEYSCSVEGDACECKPGYEPGEDEECRDVQSVNTTVSIDYPFEGKEKQAQIAAAKADAIEQWQSSFNASWSRAKSASVSCDVRESDGIILCHASGAPCNKPNCQYFPSEEMQIGAGLSPSEQEAEAVAIWQQQFQIASKCEPEGQIATIPGYELACRDAETDSSGWAYQSCAVKGEICCEKKPKRPAIKHYTPRPPIVIVPPVVVPDCPPGSYERHGQCVPFLKPCPPGTIRRHGKCVKIVHCPPGTRRIGNRCVRIANPKIKRCPAGTVRRGNRCVRIPKPKR